MNFKYWLLNEVDWESDPSEFGFSDVVKTCMSHEELVKQLNEELDRLKVKSGKRERFFRSAERRPERMLMPQFTKGNIINPREPVLGRSGKGKASMQTIKEFIEVLTAEPKEVFGEGLKSEHSNILNPEVFTVNTGIPALRAIVFDKAEEKFYSVNTCLGAGTCVMNCFALKGFYVMNDGKNMKLHQRINLLVNDPQRYYEKALMELRAFAMKVIPPTRDFPEGRTLKIRWNDAGDWFSETYFQIARKITDELKKIEISLPAIDLYGKGNKSKLSFKDRIHSYAYTKQHKYIELGRRHGITMNFSLGAKEGEKGQVDYSKTKISAIVPRIVFKDYFDTSEEGEELRFRAGKTKDQLRRAIHSWAMLNGHLGRNDKLENLIFTDELVRIPEGRTFKYNVIVLPRGDSDISAQRRDVHWTFLLEH